MPKGITKSLFVMLFTMTFLVSLIYASMAVIFAYVTEDALIERLLLNQARILSLHANVAQPPPLPNYMSLYEQQNLPKVIANELEKKPNATEIFTNDGEHYHLTPVTLADDTDTILVATVTELLVVTTLATELVSLFISVFLGLLVFAAAIAFLGAKVIAKPLKQLTAQVKSYSKVTPVAANILKRDDEIGYLASQLNNTMGKLITTLEREQAFTSDVSHELRTPVSILNNAITLLPDSSQDKTLMQPCIKDITDILDALLALARTENQNVNDLNLCHLIEKTVLDLDSLINQHNAQLDIELTTNTLVTGNEQIISMLVRNALENAIYHGDCNYPVSIMLRDNKLCISNMVMDADQDVAQQHRFGHGHKLIAKLADNTGWLMKKSISQQKYLLEFQLPALSTS
ncbi:HAMP domain-containing sensor histidine kinase [Alteromonadaceae bacterium BrNp21-10]|nr:HAMP domain-containing sensor histidine kinase [Alteromonadaceae bacterium BrNp21-10]